MASQPDVASVKAALRAATRTLDLILGFGEPGTGAAAAGLAPFTGVQYAADQVRFYDDTNMLPVNSSWHAPVDNVVYHGMDWLCPGWTGPLGDMLRAQHGNVTAEWTAREVNARLQTGNLHIAIYEVKNQVMFMAQSFLPKGGGEKARPAYSQPFVRLDMKAIMSVKPPGS